MSIIIIIIIIIITKYIVPFLKDMPPSFKTAIVLI
jgi:hypothetical protein